MTNIVIVLTTVPDGDQGEAIAQALVDEHLAACVNVSGAMISIFRWEGRVSRDVERQLVIKTTEDRVDAVRARLLQLHPYDLPECLVCPVIDGTPGYLAWVRTASAPP